MALSYDLELDHVSPRQWEVRSDYLVQVCVIWVDPVDELMLHVCYVSVYLEHRLVQHTLRNHASIK